MNRASHMLSLLLFIGLVWYSFYELMPTKITGKGTPETEFSSQRALVHLEQIAAEPHYLGSPGHDATRAYISEQLEAMGLEVSIQEAYDFNEDWGQLVKPRNILARIEGNGNGKALLLLSHYDSAPSHSLGASDAGSGVVTILESVRAFLASGKTPTNDIIILITDSEELGLNGASTFVNQHPWAQEVGLVLNFEARGSGGPSNMIVETNGGNENLIKAFAEANPDYPVASSLMYSIYKMLPNDTDSTIFREDGDIDSFFFAFIDDHYDYHTVNDNVENLNRNSLEHQGSYLMPLLTYFADANLSTVKGEQDYVYFSHALFDFVKYPFSWALPMVLIGWFILIGLLLWGSKTGQLKGAAWGKAGGVFLLALLLSGGLTFGLTKLLYVIYPQYGEIRHGFTYNGHYYIVAFVMLTLWLFFWLYSRFCKEVSRANMMVIPLFIWMILNTLLAIKLTGAAYFIVPVFFALLILAYLIKYPKADPVILLLLSAPAITMFSPLIQFFPVGLGLEMLAASALFTGLLFGLTVAVSGAFPFIKYMGRACLFFMLIFLIAAHTQSSFNQERPKPNSLVYYQDDESNEAFMLTYDNILDDWTIAVLGENPLKADTLVSSAAGSKYNTGYSYGVPTDNKNIPALAGRFELDTTDADLYRLTVIPERRIHRMAIYSDTIYKFKALAYNGNEAKPDSLGFVWRTRRSNYMGQFHISDSDSLEIAFKPGGDKLPVFKFLSYSYDLMERDEFNIAERDSTMIPTPFVVNDAVATLSVFDTSEMLPQPSDTITQQ